MFLRRKLLIICISTKQYIPCYFSTKQYIPLCFYAKHLPDSPQNNTYPTIHISLFFFFWWVLQHCTGFARLVWGRLRVHRVFIYSNWFVCSVCFCSLLKTIHILQYISPYFSAKLYIYIYLFFCKRALCFCPRECSCEMVQTCVWEIQK